MVSKNRDEVYFIVAAVIFMAVILLVGGGCQSKSTIEASGTATVKHVVTVEFGVCDTIQDPVAKIECVTTLMEILKEALKEKEE